MQYTLDRVTPQMEDEPVRFDNGQRMPDFVMVYVPLEDWTAAGSPDRVTVQLTKVDVPEEERTPTEGEEA